MKYGGNLVTHLGAQIQKSHQFCDDLYSYSIHLLNQNEVLEPKDLKSARVFLLEGSATVNEKIQLAEREDSVQAENVKLHIQSSSPLTRVLVVGAKASLTSAEELKHFKAQSLKRVEKPWGNEIWITGEHPQYCLKKIFIKKGTKTSLQYHNQKRETNVLFEGQARLHFKKDDSVSIQNITSEDIAYCDLPQVSVIDVFPLTIHRLEAVSDILLYEASTPQLDDVVRISDDSNRGNGRIQSEHDKK
jgi:mannose-6-phosphate isomerase-like protein (cupin superfamily)